MPWCIIIILRKSGRVSPICWCFRTQETTYISLERLRHKSRPAEDNVYALYLASILCFSPLDLLLEPSLTSWAFTISLKLCVLWVSEILVTRSDCILCSVSVCMFEYKLGLDLPTSSLLSKSNPLRNGLCSIIGLVNAPYSDGSKQILLEGPQ